MLPITFDTIILYYIVICEYDCHYFCNIGDIFKEKSWQVSIVYLREIDGVNNILAFF